MFEAGNRGGKRDLSNSNVKITEVQITVQKLPRVGSGESPDHLNSKAGVAQLLWSSPA